MKAHLRYGVIAFALLGSVGAGIAQTKTPGMGDPMAPSGMSSGGGSSLQSQPLQLTAPQKTAIFKAVNQERAKITPPPNFQAAVGAPVPASAELYPLPDAALAQAPAAKPYKYTFAQNQVVLIDPTTMRVVEVIRQ